MIEYKSLLRDMTAIMSVSGHEKEAAAELLPIIDKYFDEIKLDGVGNIILKKSCKKENAPRVMLDAHFDEVGMAVTGIHEGGFLSVAPVGGIDPTILSASEACVYGKEKIYGIFTVTPPHLMKKEDEKKPPSFDELKIDTGYEKEELEEIIEIGDPVKYLADGADLLSDKIAGAGFDDKSCAAALISAVSNVDSADLVYDVYVVLSSREEVGGRGAACAAYEIKPDFAVVTDVNFATAPGVNPSESGKRGEGPMISLSAVTDRKLTSKIINIAKDARINITTVVESSNTGTNATSLVLTEDGVPTAVVSLPLSGMHTFSESISLKDAAAFISLIEKIITSGSLAERRFDV